MHTISLRLPPIRRVQLLPALGLPHQSLFLSLLILLYSTEEDETVVAPSQHYSLIRSLLSVSTTPLEIHTLPQSHSLLDQGSQVHRTRRPSIHSFIDRSFLCRLIEPAITSIDRSRSFRPATIRICLATHLRSPFIQHREPVEGSALHNRTKSTLLEQLKAKA